MARSTALLHASLVTAISSSTQYYRLSSGSDSSKEPSLEESIVAVADLEVDADVVGDCYL